MAEDQLTRQKGQLHDMISTGGAKHGVKNGYTRPGERNQMSHAAQWRQGAQGWLYLRSAGSEQWVPLK